MLSSSTTPKTRKSNKEPPKRDECLARAREIFAKVSSNDTGRERKIVEDTVRMVAQALANNYPLKQASFARVLHSLEKTDKTVRISHIPMFLAAKVYGSQDTMFPKVSAAIQPLLRLSEEVPEAPLPIEIPVVKSTLGTKKTIKKPETAQHLGNPQPVPTGQPVYGQNMYGDPNFWGPLVDDPGNYQGVVEYQTKNARDDPVDLDGLQESISTLWEMISASYPDVASKVLTAIIDVLFEDLPDLRECAKAAAITAMGGQNAVE